MAAAEEEDEEGKWPLRVWACVHVMRSQIFVISQALFFFESEDGSTYAVIGVDEKNTG